MAPIAYASTTPLFARNSAISRGNCPMRFHNASCPSIAVTEKHLEKV